MPTADRSTVLLLASCVVACCAIACARDDPAPTRGSAPRPASVEEATRALTQELLRGMPWERVRAKVIHANRIQAITVRASVRLTCPNVRIVTSVPTPKNTGMRDFNRLDLIEVDHLEAHHLEAAEIVADEIVAMKVDAPSASPR